MLHTRLKKKPRIIQKNRQPRLQIQEEKQKRNRRTSPEAITNKTRITRKWKKKKKRVLRCWYRWCLPSMVSFGSSLSNASNSLNVFLVFPFSLSFSFYFIGFCFFCCFKNSIYICLLLSVF